MADVRTTATTNVTIYDETGTERGTVAAPLNIQGISYATSTVTRVSSSATVVTLKAANTSRRGLYIFNESTQVLYIKFGSAATNTDYTVRMVANSYFELPEPMYNGIVTGIWVSANGAAQVTEVT